MSINIYPEILMGSPPDEFDDDVEEETQNIYKACKGWGTDENGVIEALATKTADRRYEIYLHYKHLYDKDLKDVMKSECGNGDLGFALQLLALPIDQAEAKIIRKASRGFGTSEHLLWPILCGRSNDEMNRLKNACFEHYGDDLSVLMASELGGDLERFVFHCLQAGEEEFDEEYHSSEKADEDADLFHEAGEGRWGTDEAGLFAIIAKSPPEHMVNVNDVYVEKYGRTLLAALGSELGGQVAKACAYAVGMKIQPYKTVAALIKEACRGFGTDEVALTSALIRYQMIMEDVNIAHVEEYGKTVHQRVRNETSGKYEKLLIAVVNAAKEEEEEE